MPARPADDGACVSAGLRRPADVWVPRGKQGGPEALDFALSSGMRANMYRQAADASSVFFVLREIRTGQACYKNTEAGCAEAGLHFTPMILEAHGGGWSNIFCDVLGWIASTAAAVHHQDPGQVSFRIGQRISSTLQRENARAVMRRFPQWEEDIPASGWESVAFVEAW